LSVLKTKKTAPAELNAGAGVKLLGVTLLLRARRCLGPLRSGLTLRGGLPLGLSLTLGGFLTLRGRLALWRRLALWLGLTLRRRLTLRLAALHIALFRATLTALP
jgi:hypothetical protein